MVGSHHGVCLFGLHRGVHEACNASHTSKIPLCCTNIALQGRQVFSESRDPLDAKESSTCAEAEIACDEKSMDLSEKEVILKAKQERLAAITKGGLSLA